MMPQIKWVERKFNFGYDKGYAPLFIERLKMTSPHLEELLLNCSEAKAAEQIGENWSVKQHIGHLSDLELLHDARIDDFIARKDVLRAADMTNQATYGANHNQRSIADLCTQLRKVRSSFIQRIINLDDLVFDHYALHPRLQQRASLTDILYFVAEHDTHHLARISGMLQ